MEGLAAGTDHAGAQDPVHDETAGDILQLFGHVLAQLLEPAAARGAGNSRREHRLMAWQMIRQRAPLWPAFSSGRCRRGSVGRDLCGSCDLFLFQRQFKLVKRLRARPELLTPQAHQLMLQLLDQNVAVLELGRQRRQKPLQNSRVVRQLLDIVEHGGNIPEPRRFRNPQTALNRYYPVVSGRQVRRGMRQSIPSSNIDNCAGVTDTLPCAGDGHTNRPRSSRLENRHAPWPSHQITLIRSPRRPRNTNRWPQ